MSKTNPLPSVSADLIACVQQLEQLEAELAKIARSFSMEQMEERIADDEKWVAEQKYLREHWQTSVTPAHRWVPVEERLPEEESAVIAFEPNAPEPVREVWFDRGIFADYEGWVALAVTHWQPLPLPPEAEDE